MHRLTVLLVLAQLALAGPAGAQAGLTFDEILEAEVVLQSAGYETGPPNGVIGRQTTEAILAYQRDWQLPESGVLTPDLYARLKREDPATRAQWFPTNAGCEVWNDAPQARETVTWTGGCSGGRLSGEGTLVWSSMLRGQTVEQRHEGSFREGQEEGYGISSYVDGGRYEGEFRGGEREGRGVRVLSDGSRYEGQWRDNLPQGSGTLTMSDGRVFSGEWSQGCLVGQRVAFETAPAYCAF